MGEQGIGLGEAGFEGGGILLQGGEVFFVLLLRRIEFGDLRGDLLEKRLVLGFEVGIAEALELEL